MRISDVLLPEYDHEMANTRRMLERVPDDRWTWKPHARSWSLGELAAHVANIPSWIPQLLETDSMDIAPEGEGQSKRDIPQNRTELLEQFDKFVAAGRSALAAAENPLLMESWTLLAGGKTVFSLPRTAVLRSFVMNHGIHHRGQLSMYLRLNDVPLPGMYGPSGDESGS